MEPIPMLIAAAVALIVGLPFLFLTRGVRPAGEIMVEAAEKAGRVTRGTLERSVFLRGDVEDRRAENRQSQWAVVYGYEVDGVRYTFRGVTRSSPVPSILLYYPEGRPQAAIPKSMGGRRFGGAYLLRSFVPVVIWAAVYWMLKSVM